jgi:glutaredoxin
MVQVVLYSKPGCHLCDDVKEQLYRLRQEHAFELRECNILEDPEALANFKDEIPVVFVNGRKAFKYYFDEKQFVRRIHDAQLTTGRG